MNTALDTIFETGLPPAGLLPFWEEPHTAIYIYGTGTFGQDILQTMRGKGISVAGFMDHRIREGQYILGLPVFRPEDIPGPADQRTHTAVVIGIHNRDAMIREIIEHLGELGYQHVINPIAFYTLFEADLGIRYWLTSPRFYRTLRGPVEDAYELLSDEASRANYLALLKFRLGGDYSALPMPDVEHQYFPVDLPGWQSPLRLIDCGAYEGDTIGSFLRNGTTLQAVAAFEPDQDNFRRLARFAEENQKGIPESYLWPCGVSKTTSQLRFESGHGEASSVSGSGSDVVQCISLDEALPTFAPNLIKMDIEGAEIDALLGARKLITAHQPGLAISVYHRPEHLWQIPLLIAQIAQASRAKYEYGLRLHAQNGFDTIFYAIPRR